MTTDKQWAEHLCLIMGVSRSPGNLKLATRFIGEYRDGNTEAEPNHWQQAVVDELVVLHLLNDSNAHDPKKAIADVIAWNTKIALDPAVSKEARDLQASGQTILVKFQGKAISAYSGSHGPVLVNPARVGWVAANGWCTHLWIDGKWFEVSGGVDEVANCLGQVVNGKDR